MENSLSACTVATDLFGEALGVVDGHSTVGAVVAGVAWFASRGALGFGELTGDMSTVFDLSELHMPGSAISFAEYTLDELNAIDVALLSAKELELYTKTHA